MHNKVLAIAAALCALALSHKAFSQSAPFHFLSAASTNSTSVTVGLSKVLSVVAINTTATLYYLKLYDKAVAPTCNTDPVKWSVPVPFGISSSGGGAAIAIPDGLLFISGVGFCLTGGSADNDNTNAATGVTLNFGIKQ